MNPVADVWVYLSASPLLWLTLTLVAYIGAFVLYEGSRFNPLVNPVALSILLLTGLLVATGLTSGLKRLPSYSATAPM